jgi:cytidylate kinase
LSEIIAIDGPAGAGKSTVARRIANALEFTYLDTGAMYRSVAWLAIQNGLDQQAESELVALARDCTIEFGLLTPQGTQTVHVNEIDATEAIRSPEVSNFTSAISAIGAVRKVIVAHQREIALRANLGVVLEGRDIGTVVFPNAQLKVFLTASAEERAKRRFAELNSHGAVVHFDEVLQDQIDRDRRDSSRAASPLVAAADAVHIDTDGKSVDEIVRTVLDLHRERTGAEEIKSPETLNDR